MGFRLLGRIVSFLRLSRDEDLREAVEPALQVYLQGLDEDDPAIHKEVLGHLDAIPIRRPDIVAALQKFLQRSDLPAENRETALLALKAQTAAADSHTKQRPTRD